MSDHEYEVEHIQRNRLEIPGGEGGKKKKYCGLTVNRYLKDYILFFLENDFQHGSNGLARLCIGMDIHQGKVLTLRLRITTNSTSTFIYVLEASKVSYAYSLDPDEMPSKSTSHLDPSCLTHRHVTIFSPTLRDIE